MNNTLAFGLGLAARVFSAVLTHYADWLLHKLIEGAECSRDFVADLGRFGHWSLRVLAGQMCGRSARHFDDYGEEMEPGWYGN